MLDRPNAISFLAAWVDACALWRMFMPHLNLPGSSFFCFTQYPDWSKFSGQDVVVVQRCCTEAQMRFIQTCRKLDIKLVYDLDDNMWEIPPANPAYNVLNAYREGFGACMQMVDVVSTSTKTLAKEIRRHVKTLRNSVTGKEIPIIVAENRIDARLFAPVQPPEEKIIGWQGSTSHIGDLELVEEAIQKVAAEHADWTVELRGYIPASLKVLPNVRFRPWMPVSEYPARMPTWGWSIALAPVTDEPFNYSKSCIKMVEAAYCSIPCLASWVRPYEEFCSHDPELKWLLCAGRSNWVSKVRDLVNDDARREELGRRCHQVMKQHYSFAREHEGWRAVLEAAR